MKRFTISLSDDLAADFDNWIQARAYVNRSEAVRGLLHLLGITSKDDSIAFLHIPYFLSSWVK